MDLPSLSSVLLQYTFSSHRFSLTLAKFDELKIKCLNYVVFRWSASSSGLSPWCHLVSLSIDVWLREFYCSRYDHVEGRTIRFKKYNRKYSLAMGSMIPDPFLKPHCNLQLGFCSGKTNNKTLLSPLSILFSTPQPPIRESLDSKQINPHFIRGGKGGNFLRSWR